MAKGKILLVEDDTLLARMYQAKFTNEGYEVFIAGDGIQGLEIVKTQKPDFMILDMMMPKLSGLDLLSQVRQDPAIQNTPAIMLSNLSQPQEIEKAKALGIKEFLLKANYTPSQIVEKVKQYLG